MAKPSNLSNIVRQLLELEGDALFDKIAELEPTAERKAQLRWALPMLAQAVCSAFDEGEERSRDAERQRKTRALSELAVKVLAVQGRQNYGNPEQMWEPDKDARQAVRTAKLMMDEAELLVLAEEEAHAELEQVRAAHGTCVGCGHPADSQDHREQCIPHANGGAPS